MKKKQKPWEVSIAVKITAAILWAFVLCGFLVSIFLQRNAEDDLRAEFTADADRAAYLISGLIQEAGGLPNKIPQEKLQNIFSMFHFTSIEILHGKDSLTVGKRKIGSPLVERNLIKMGGIKGNTASGTVVPSLIRLSQIRLSHPPIKKVLHERRNRMLAGIGAVFLLFSLFLAFLMRIVVIKPILELVGAVTKISKGDIKLRLKGKRQDEFGYLARFLNLMLEKISKQRIGIEAALHKARDSDRAKSVFLANMSHELRTPLNAIIGYSEILIEDENEKRNEQGVADLDKIRNSALQLTSMINDILDLSKIEAGRMDIHTEKFSVSDTLKEACDIIRPLAERRGNVLSLEYEESPDLIQTDKMKFRQVLTNLLSNASKFTENGTIRLVAAEFRSKGKDWLRIEVSDTGIGIAPEQMDSLFQPFIQASPEVARDFGGTGLGLAISRRFCEMLGGTLNASSTLSRGATFRMELPVIYEAIPEEYEAAPEELPFGVGEDMHAQNSKIGV